MAAETEKTMATTTGVGLASGATGAAAGALMATIVGGGLGLIAGLMFGMGSARRRAT